MENTARCYGCMQSIEKEDKVCPHCGFDGNHYATKFYQLKLGTMLNNRYVIGKMLGEGGFGITYIGWDCNLEVPVAVKEYYPNGLVNRDTTSGNKTVFTMEGSKRESFELGLTKVINEARRMAKFRNLQGVVTVVDFFKENGTAYIVMEYVQGITFNEYLKKHGKVSANQVLKVFRPLIHSLKQVHGSGLIHRDISPDNIMITDNGEIRLLDFGAARDFGEDEKSLSIMLKRGYAPEEQYRSRGVQGPWTDVYALCATMYKMMTGITPMESLDRMSDDDLKSPSELGIEIEKAVEQTLLKGLAVFQRDRIADMEELYNCLYGELQNDMSLSGVIETEVIKEQKLELVDSIDTIEEGTQLLEDESEEGTQLLEEDPEEGTQLLEEEPEEGTQLLEEEPEDGTQLLEEELEEGTQLLEEDIIQKEVAITKEPDTITSTPNYVNHWPEEDKENENEFYNENESSDTKINKELKKYIVGILAVGLIGIIVLFFALRDTNTYRYNYMYAGTSVKESESGEWNGEYDCVVKNTYDKNNNWIQQEVFDKDGSVISDSRTYTHEDEEYIYEYDYRIYSERLEIVEISKYGIYDTSDKILSSTLCDISDDYSSYDEILSEYLYEYYEDGTRKKYTEFESEIIRLCEEYNEMGALVHVSKYDTTGNMSTEEEYDNSGNMIKKYYYHSDGSCSEYTYDTSNNLVGEVKYDSNGNGSGYEEAKLELDVYGTKITGKAKNHYNLKQGKKELVSQEVLSYEINKSGYHATVQEVLNEAEVYMTKNQGMTDEIIAKLNEHRAEKGLRAFATNKGMNRFACFLAFEDSYSDGESGKRYDGSSIWNVLYDMEDANIDTSEIFGFGSHTYSAIGFYRWFSKADTVQDIVTGLILDTDISDNEVNFISGNYEGIGIGIVQDPVGNYCIAIYLEQCTPN